MFKKNYHSIKVVKQARYYNYAYMYDNSVMFVCMLCKSLGDKLTDLLSHSILFSDSSSVFVMGRPLVGILQSYG